MRIKGYAKSVIGSREMNQDSFLVDNDRGFFGVADGVGGGLKGEVASQMATTGFKDKAPLEGSLKPTFEALQAAVHKEAMDQFGEALMGTTFTAIRLRDGRGTLCHAGDSRCYLFESSQLRQLTEDHEAYDERYGGTVLGSYLGIPADIHPLTLLEENFPLVAGTRFLLCSDGLYRQVTESRLVELMRTEAADPDKMLEIMCTEASKAEYSDNITVVYVEVDA